MRERNYKLSRYARDGTEFQIIEFVPKSDPQVARLLLSRPDIFPGYTKEGFEKAFSRHFSIQTAAQVEDSERWLYCMSASPQAAA